MATTKSQFVLTKDARIHIVRTFPLLDDNHTGSRPTLIFLHFWGGSSRTWDPLISLLSHAYQTIAIDFRGWGASSSSDPASEAYSISHLAEDVWEVIQQCSDVCEYVLIGHSMGAKVAQLLAAASPRSPSPIPTMALRPSYHHHDKLLKALILVCPAPPTPLVLPKDMREQQLHAYDTAKSAEFVVRNVLTSTVLDAVMVDSLVEDMLQGDEKARAAWPSYAMAEDISANGKKIDVRSLVIATEKDVVEPVERVMREVVGRMSAAEFVVIKDSGHLAPVEAPKELAGNILRFLDAFTLEV